MQHYDKICESHYTRYWALNLFYYLYIGVKTTFYYS